MKHIKNIWIIVVAVLLALVAGSVALLYWRDAFSPKQIVSLQITGPQQAAMGEQIQYTVTYKNNGNFTLESPKLVFNFPDNSITDSGDTRVSQQVPNLAPGQQAQLTFSGKLLGKQGDVKTAQASFTYVPHGLSIRYESDASFATTISSVPITLTYDLPASVEKGKRVSYSINYFSNANVQLSPASIKLDPVQGFAIASADPSSLDNVEWKLGALQKSQGGRITISGNVTADAPSALHFAAHLGVWVQGAFVVIEDVSQDVPVAQPQLYTSLQVNGSTDYVAAAGDQLRYQLLVRNVEASAFDQVPVSVSLSGAPLDVSSVASSQGQVQTGSRGAQITFDPSKVSSLTNLRPQQEALLSFTANLSRNWVPTPSDYNQSMVKAVVNVAGTQKEFDIKLRTNLAVSQTLAHGPSDTGPTPPQVDQPTTYTVTWKLQNSLNDLSNAKVKATLAPGVTLTSQIIPSDQVANFTLDSASRQIVWSPGNLAAGQGFANAPQSVSFQISFEPSLLQIGSAAQLISQAIAIGQDQFAGQTIQSIAPALTTASLQGSTGAIQP